MKRRRSMCRFAAGADEQGEGLPPGAPCGVVCGQALRPCGPSGGLPTASRLRRACTPFLIETFPETAKPTTLRALSRAHSPDRRSTYLSGKAVQANRATSGRIRILATSLKFPPEAPSQTACSPYETGCFSWSICLQFVAM